MYLILAFAIEYLNMKNEKFIDFIAVIVALIGILVGTGWFLNISILKNISPNWPEMKFVVAVCFFLAGVSLHFTSKLLSIKSGIYLFLLSIVVAILTGILLISCVLGLHTGLEDLYVNESQKNIVLIVPSPSMGVIIGLMLSVIGSIVVMLDQFKGVIVLNKIGWLLVGLGLIGVIACFSNCLFLMSLHSAVLFILLGLGHMMLESPKPTGLCQ